MTHDVTGLMPAPDGRVRGPMLAGLGIVAAFGVGIAVGAVAPSILDAAAAAGQTTGTGMGAAATVAQPTTARIAELQAAQVGGGGLDLVSGPTVSARAAGPIIVLAPATIAELQAAQAGGGGLDVARARTATAVDLTPSRVARAPGRAEGRRRTRPGGSDEVGRVLRPPGRTPTASRPRVAASSAFSCSGHGTTDHPPTRVVTSRPGRPSLRDGDAQPDPRLLGPRLPARRDPPVGPHVRRLCHGPGPRPDVRSDVRRWTRARRLQRGVRPARAPPRRPRRERADGAVPADPPRAPRGRRRRPRRVRADGDHRGGPRDGRDEHRPVHRGAADGERHRARLRRPDT